MKINLPQIDWIMFFCLLPILGVGLLTMTSFVSDDSLFRHQLIWIVFSISVFFICSYIDFRFLKRTDILIGLFMIFSIMLLLLPVFGSKINGAQSWFSFGFFSFQPSDLMKLVVVLMFAKYLSRRHIEIGNFKHIFITGLYALVPFLLIAIQPDFGSAMVILFIWVGMVIVSGISKKHLLLVFGLACLSFGLLWFLVFKPYQKDRILNFIDPLSSIKGSGYNVYQSTIAFGSGQLLGKGVGFGTQSRLKFLPEYQTDFIFAAYAEEWGFVGVITLFLLYILVVWRILLNALLGASNFEILFGIGIAIYFMTHIIVNIGMNMGVMPVTGITLPFMSYGGSHILTEFIALGILMGMRRYSRVAHRDDMRNEFLGI